MEKDYLFALLAACAADDKRMMKFVGRTIAFGTFFSQISVVEAMMVSIGGLPTNVVKFNTNFKWPIFYLKVHFCERASLCYFFSNFLDAASLRIDSFFLDISSLVLISFLLP